MRKWTRDQVLSFAGLCIAIVALVAGVYSPELRHKLGADGENVPEVIASTTESSPVPAIQDSKHPTTELTRPETARDTGQWRALANFSYTTDLRWGSIEVGMLRTAVEQKLGPIQCLPEEDTDGDYCACRGLHNEIALIVDLRNAETRNDPDICTRGDSRLDKFTILLPEAERFAPHDEIVGVLRAHLPQMRHVQGSEPQARDERSRHRPTYTFADGRYNLRINYEAGAVEVDRTDSH